MTITKAEGKNVCSGFVIPGEVGMPSIIAPFFSHVTVTCKTTLFSLCIESLCQI